MNIEILTKKQMQLLLWFLLSWEVEWEKVKEYRKNLSKNKIEINK